MIIIDEALIETKNEGKLQSNLLEEIISISMVFHDSCHLTRPYNVIDPLRRVLHLIGDNYKEFSHFGKDGLCYGVDRVLRIMNPELVVKICLDRVNEAKNIGSDIIITLYPFCIFNFRDAAKEVEKSEVKSLYYYFREYLQVNVREK